MNPVTRSGVVVDDTKADRWADEAEAGYDIDYLRAHNWWIDADRRLVIGPDTKGHYLELVVAKLADGDDLVIHAMRMRPEYGALL